jgi:lysophospholipase L1-like esterase
MPTLPSVRQLTGLRSSLLAGIVALLAFPALLVTHETFRPVEHRFALQGERDAVTVDLPAQEPMHLEFELSVQAAGDGDAGVELRVNNMSIARVAPRARYVFQRIRVPVPAAAVRAGPNQLQFEAYGGPDVRFELRGRLHNYYGINPRFPRAFVVADEAVWQRWSQLGVVAALVRFVGFALASIFVMLLFRRTLALLDVRAAGGTLLAPAVVLWGVVAYSAATSVHVWLSVEALLAAVLLPYALVWVGAWARVHRGLVARLAVAAVITLVGTEVLFRAYNWLNPSFIFYSDAYDRFRPRPGERHFDTVLNGRGFNDVEYPTAKPPGVRRFVAIGDSFTMGVVPYASNYLTLVEQDLAGDRPTEVINMGIPGTEPKDYLSILVAEGLAFAPDVVLVGFYIGNDFEAAARRPYEYSYVATFFNFLWQLRFVETPSNAGLGEVSADYDDERPGFSRERFLEVEADRAVIFMNDNAAFTTAVSRAAGYLREMRDVASRAGASVVVVLMPAEVQVDAELQDDVIRARQSPRDRFDFERPNRLLAAALTDAGLPFVDLLPVFAKQARSTRLYKPQDTHWNIAGNRVAAAALAAELRRLN